jgi:chromosomal replication initiator protein
MAVDELAFTLDDLDAAGAGIVVASTWPPGQWGADDGLTGRLASRLSGGLAVRLDLPGADLRRRYFLARAHQRGLLVGTQAVDWVINDLPTEGGFPPLEGILTRLALEAGMRPRRAREVLDLDFVRKVLDHDLQSDPPRAVTLADAARSVARVFRVTLRDLRSASRSSGVVEARHFAMYLARQQTEASFATIGAYFGGRDPATVRHACRAAAARLEARPDLVAAMLKLQKPTGSSASASA